MQLLYAAPHVGGGGETTAARVSPRAGRRPDGPDRAQQRSQRPVEQQARQAAEQTERRHAGPATRALTPRAPASAVVVLHVTPAHDTAAVGTGFQIAVATLSGNSLRQTVHTRCASVHQAAKLVAALLRVAGVTAGLAESNNSLPRMGL